ncbi:MAG TPA: DHA2 family efflux MFS transporter permease subunit, partial [Desulfobaccales bacterium]|nr:DHA2 family efflux MFS transporter permease subunit [Desulfobaccales bacterium]
IVGPVMGGWVTDNLTWRWAFYINLPIGILSLLLTLLFVFDPDYIRKQRAGSIDYWGLGLLIVGLGALQIVLDKGQQDDWFSSAFITRLTIIAVVALVILIWHELKTKHPVVDLRLFKERNYASGTTIMFFFGYVLYGSIMLLPLFLQTLMGYDATLAGYALAFGGIGSLMIMPVVGRLTMVMDSRKIVFVGLVLNAYAVYLMSGYTTTINFFHAWFPRFVQGFGLGSTFVALTTLTMSRVSQEKMGNATGIFNLMRNLGGSFGIAPATTLLARRSQFHQTRLVERLTPLNHPFDQWQHQLSQLIPSLGPNWDWWSAPQAMATLYQEVQRQAKMLAFSDDYWFFTIVFLCLLPLVFLMRHSPKPEGEEPPALH